MVTSFSARRWDNPNDLSKNLSGEMLYMIASRLIRSLPGMVLLVWLSFLMNLRAVDTFCLNLSRAQQYSSDVGPHTGSGGMPGHECYQKNCQKCHGPDGTGKPVRNRLPDIPDFTDGKWQAGRSDIQLRVSIQEGRGTAMPGFEGKLTDEQMRAVVAHIRAFKTMHR